jgi:HK97 family phage portal protein|tara:strand:+ start:17151 stop:19355 length:2205 start_codon:yes stop_codon:yes gene_type:complete
MGILDIFRQPVPPLPEKKAPKIKNAPAGEFIAPAFKNSIPSDKDATELIDASALGWVYACSSVIADAVARTPIKLFKRTPDGPIEIEQHPILELLFQVNNFTTYYDHVVKTQMYLEGVGEAPWYIERSGTKPKNILLLRPDRIEIIFDEKDIIGGYKYKNSDGSFVKIEADDIIFLRNPSLTSEFRGYGTLQAAAVTVDTEDFAEKYNRNFFFNGAKPDFVLETDSTLTERTIRRLKKAWEALYRGVDNAHKMAILDSGLKLNTLGMTQKDMDFYNQLQWSRDKILAIFRVPKPVLGITEDVNLANAEVAELTFAKYTIVPRLERLIQQLNEFLVPMFGDNLFLEFEDPTPENRQELADFYNKAIEGGWMTVNEVREAEGFPGLIGGDAVLKPVNLVPQMSVDPTSQVEEEKSFTLQMMNNKITNSRKREKIAEALQPLLKKKIRKDVEKKRVKKKAKKKIKKKSYQSLLSTQESKTLFHESLILKSAQKFEDDIETMFQNVFKQQERIILDAFDQQEVIKAPSEEDTNKLIDDLWDKDTMNQLIVLAYAPLFLELFREQSSATQDFLNLRVGDVTRNADVVSEITETNLQLSGTVNDATIKNIKKTLALGVVEGEGANMLKERIQQVFTDASDKRAEMIARTETIRGSNLAANTVYEKAGVKTKEWITAIDERTCQWCGPMDGTQLKVSDNFFDKGSTFEGREGGILNLNYSDTKGPPLHPNCRCTLGPVIEI